MKEITEGLIKIPPRMLATVMGFAHREILWWARDQLKGRTKEFPDHYREFKTLVSLYCPDGLPKEPYGDIREKPLRVRSYHFNPEGLPGNYPTGQDLTYLVALDWKNTRTHGSWRPKTKAIVVCPLSHDWMLRYPQKSNQESLASLFLAIEATVEHELRHAVQDIVLADRDPRQVGRLPDYAAHGSDYYNSRIEFDPTIGSSAKDFVDHLNMLKSYGKKIDLGHAIRLTVGMKKAGFFADFKPDPFFVSLKKHSMKRYTIGVRKFVAEVKRIIDGDLHENHIDLNEAVDIPPTRYGYWITDEGKFIVVRNAGHLDVLPERWRYVNAFNAGWIRIVIEYDRLGVGIGRDSVSMRAISSLRQLVRQRSDLTVFELDIRSRHPTEANYEVKHFDQSSSLLLAVNENKRSRNLAEAEKGGELNDEPGWERVQRMEFDPRQGELFRDSPYQHEGSFDGFDVATIPEDDGHSYTYVVFRSGEPIAYAELISYTEIEDDSPIPADDCYQVKAIRVGRSGMSLASRLYAWMVTNGHIDRLYGDEMQTQSGAAIWVKLLADPRVRLFRDEDCRVEPIRTRDQLEAIYDSDEARVFATRCENAGRGRANR